MNRYTIRQSRGMWMVLDTFDNDRVMAFGKMYSDVWGVARELNRESIEDRDAN